MNFISIKHYCIQVYNFSTQRSNNTSGGNYEFFTWKRVPNAFNKISEHCTVHVPRICRNFSSHMLDFHFKAQGELITLGHNAISENRELLSFTCCDSIYDIFSKWNLISNPFENIAFELVWNTFSRKKEKEENHCIIRESLVPVWKRHHLDY